MSTGTRIFALLGALALTAGPLRCAAFPDPLDVPAEKTSLATRNLLNGIALAGKRLVAVGQRGHIVYSDDDGKRWTQAVVPVSTDLTAVSFPTAKSGWTVGHDGVVLATRDGGVTWTKQLDGRAVGKLMHEYYIAHPPEDLPGGPEALKRFQADIARIVQEGADKPFLDLWFESERIGYVVGLFNLIFRTEDGGKTWIPLFDRTENLQRLHFYAIHGVGDDLYLAGEQGMVLRLDRESHRFRSVSVDYKGTFFGIADVGTALMAFGLRGSCYRSDDRGDHWQKIETGVPVAIAAATRMADGRIVLVSQAGHLIVSTDEGKSFDAIPTERAPSSALTTVSANELVIAGARGIRFNALKP